MSPADLFRLLRPKQWSKNLLVFAALLFTAAFKDTQSVERALLAFLAMCLASSATYIVNDLFDLERDRQHPRKKNRPLAAGRITPTVGSVVAGLVGIAALLIANYLGPMTLMVLVTYLFLQALYNLGLKRIAVADVFCIGVGFVLRAALGAAAIDVKISGWLLFCTGALALMLGFAKRRNEFIAQGGDKGVTRESLDMYSKGALDALVIMFACGAGLCYGIYAIESETAHKYPALILTSLFVFYGISRYVLLVFSLDEGGEPENLLYKDPHILLAILLFLATAVMAVMGMKLPLVAG